MIKKFFFLLLTFFILNSGAAFATGCNVAPSDLASEKYCLEKYPAPEKSLLCCLGVVAVKNEDASFCLKYSDDPDLLEHQISCLEYAGREGLSEACEHLPLVSKYYPVEGRLKASCYMNVAGVSENIEDCEPLNEICEESTEGCFGKDYAHCVWNIARKTKNLELCSTIPPNVRSADRTSPHISVRDYCQIQLMDVSSLKDCEEIWDQHERTSCFSKYCEDKECCDRILEEESKVARNRLDTVSEPVDIDREYNACLSSIAQKSNDLLTCIESQSYDCLRDIKDIPKDLDPSVCDDFENDKARGMCYGRFAFDQGSLALCEENFADNYDIFRDCIYPLEYPDIDMCEEINDDEMHDFCVRKAISGTGNSDYCNNYRNKDKKDNCISGVYLNQMPIGSTSKFIDIVVGIILFFVLLVVYFIKKRNIVTTITKPIVISIIYLAIARAVVLIPAILSGNKFIESIFVFAKPLRVFDLIGYVTVKRFIPYNWIYFLFSDLLAIALILIFGHLIERKERTKGKKIFLYILLLGLMLLQSYALGFLMVMAIAG
jgi:hypothetical protein